jgi:hypothetical protein
VLAGFERIADGIRRLPGVLSVAATSSLPLGGGGFYLGRVFLTEGQPEPPATRDTQAQWSVIQPGYFKTLGTRLIATCVLLHPLQLWGALCNSDMLDSKEVTSCGRQGAIFCTLERGCAIPQED